MADYFEHHSLRAPRPRTSSAHSDHTGIVLTALALLMLALLALVWTGKETLSPMPREVPVLQRVEAVAPAPATPASAPLAMRVAPAVAPPASDAIAAAGDTRAVQP